MTKGRRRAALAGVGLLVAAGAAIGLLAGRDWSASGSSSTQTTRTDPYGRLGAFRVYYRDLLADHHELVRLWRITYSAWDGERRQAFLILPRWYGPTRHPPLPLVVSPHGRGVPARDNVHFWGGLPAFGPFAVVNPDGQGRRLTLYSWGWKRQIDDLARMPEIVTRALPWLRIDRRRIYAVGSSMGGQETLMLVARHSEILAGAVALDSDTNMAARYWAFPQLRGGTRLQELARIEIGGTPVTLPRAYAARSPLSWAAAIARSGVPLRIWWSTKDKIVTNQYDESGRMYREIKRINPRAPVTQYVGTWAHSDEFHASRRLPLALVYLGLIKLDEKIPPP
ncbi:MAG: alpha/beta hydrolase family protein [Gaiellaceae bacterium]